MEPIYDTVIDGTTTEIFPDGRVVYQDDGGRYEYATIAAAIEDMDKYARYTGGFHWVKTAKEVAEWLRGNVHKVMIPKYTEIDSMGMQVAESPYFYVMPGMRMLSTTGWVRVHEGRPYAEGWPDLRDAATMGCLAKIAYDVAAKALAALVDTRQQSFPPYVGDQLLPHPLNTPPLTAALTQFHYAANLGGMTCDQAVIAMHYFFSSSNQGETDVQE